MSSANPPPRPKPSPPQSSTVREPKSLVIGALCITFLVFGIYQAIVIWVAEDRIAVGTIESLTASTKLVSYHDLAWSWLGQLKSRQRSSDDDARAHFEKALEINRFDWSSSVGLGLLLERGGDLEAAQESLERAVKSYHGPQPLWSLANFALRRGDDDLFWGSIYRAIERSPKDLASAASLCWRAFDDPAEILANGIPDTPEVTREYIEFLFSRNQPAAIVGAWQRLAPHLQADDQQQVLVYLRQLIGSGDADQTVAVWNDACRNNILPFQPFTPSRGNLITNPLFDSEPISVALDWRYPPENGGRWRYLRDPDRDYRMELELSRNRPEQAEFLVQLVPVEPETLYRFSSQYQTVELADPTGMIWAASDSANRPLGQSTSMAQSANWAEAQFQFRTGPDARFVILRLAYVRAPGTSRRVGTFRLAECSLQKVVAEVEAQ